MVFLVDGPLLQHAVCGVTDNMFLMDQLECERELGRRASIVQVYIYIHRTRYEVSLSAIVPTSIVYSPGFICVSGVCFSESDWSYFYRVGLSGFQRQPLIGPAGPRRLYLARGVALAWLNSFVAFVDILEVSLFYRT